MTNGARPISTGERDFLLMIGGARLPPEPVACIAVLSSGPASLADHPQPSERGLVLGADAYDGLDRTMPARMADISRYRAMGEKTGFDGAEVRAIGAG